MKAYLLHVPLDAEIPQCLLCSQQEPDWTMNILPLWFWEGQVLLWLWSSFDFHKNPCISITQTTELLDWAPFFPNENKCHIQVPCMLQWYFLNFWYVNSFSVFDVFDFILNDSALKLTCFQLTKFRLFKIYPSLITMNLFKANS